VLGLGHSLFTPDLEKEEFGTFEDGLPLALQLLNEALDFVGSEGATATPV
jgi:hypothetical protein